LKKKLLIPKSSNRLSGDKKFRPRLPYKILLLFLACFCIYFLSATVLKDIGISRYLEAIIWLYCLIAFIFVFLYNLVNFFVFKFFASNQKIKILSFKPLFIYKWLLTISKMSKEKKNVQYTGL